MLAMHGEVLSPEAAEHSPVKFGDQGEFVFDSVVEEFDAAGSRIIEAAVFFRHGDELRGLKIVTTPPEPGTDPDDIAPVELPFIDPESVIGILELPSETILQGSRPIRSETE